MDMHLTAAPTTIAARGTTPRRTMQTPHPAGAIGDRVTAMPVGRGGPTPVALNWETEPAPRESVSAALVADMIDECAAHRPEIGITWLCEHSGVGRNTLRTILRRQRDTVDLFIADRLCVALGRHVSELGPVENPRRKRKRK